jgi:F0F1-type ATP synthase membrane subunit b/b'
MTPALANFLFEAVNFALLAAVLGWILFKPVRRTLDRERERQIQNDKEQARLRAEAEALLEDARAAREHTDQETAKRREETLAAAREEATRFLEEARRSRMAERRAFEQELATRRAGEATALTEAVAHIASESVTELLASLEGPDLDAALTRAACAELKGLSASGRYSILVESAHRLSAEMRQLLEVAVGGAFEERVVAELGAGVRVTTPAGQIDATALSIARQAARTIAAEGIHVSQPRSVRTDG